MVNQASGAPVAAAALDQARIVGIEDQAAAAVQRLGDDELGVGDAVDVVDAVLAQMIGRDVGDDRGVARVTGSPRRRMPPRAISSTAISTRGSRKARRAPPGPE